MKDVKAAMHDFELNWKSLKNVMGVKELTPEYKGPDSEDLKKPVLNMDQSIKMLKQGIDKAVEKNPKIHL